MVQSTKRRGVRSGVLVGEQSAGARPWRSPDVTGSAGKSPGRALRRRVYVGIDYASAFVQVCAVDEQAQVVLNRRCENSVEAIERALSQHTVVAVAIEACCGAANLADEIGSKLGWLVRLTNPTLCKKMKNSPDKSDYTDARVLAELLLVGWLPMVWLAPAQLRDVRSLVRHRADLADARRACKLRITALLRDHRLVGVGKRWNKPWLLWLSREAALPPAARCVCNSLLEQLASLGRQIRQVEKHLVLMTSDDPMVQYLQQIKGIGQVTTWTLRVEIGLFGRFRNGKQLSRYCALSPQNASSGQRIADAGLTRAGNRRLRGVLIEAMWQVVRYQPKWKEFFQRLIAAGKRPCVAIAATANRFVRWLFYRARDQERRLQPTASPAAA